MPKFNNLHMGTVFVVAIIDIVIIKCACLIIVFHILLHLMIVMASVCLFVSHMFHSLSSGWHCQYVGDVVFELLFFHYSDIIMGVLAS